MKQLVVTALLLIFLSEVYTLRSPRQTNSSSNCVTKDQVEHLLRVEREFIVRQLDHHVGSVHHPAMSCDQLPDGYLTGYYWIQNSTGGINHIYCDLSESLCGGPTRGWTQVAHLDMTDIRERCPSGLSETTSSSQKRTCTKGFQSPGCSSVIYEVFGKDYTRVCGRIKAYQRSHPVGFRPYTLNLMNALTLNDSYVDGVSLTCGQRERQHIWTFAAAFDVGSINYQCSCGSEPDEHIVPAFVGRDFFCDTASQTGFEEILFKGNPLWDGEGCSSQNSCCTHNNPPWFHKQLPAATSEDIEMRLCLSEHLDYGNVLIENVEIYVQ